MDCLMPRRYSCCRVIENYVQLGDLLAADRQQKPCFMQQRLYEMQPELLPGLTYFAEWNLFAANHQHHPLRSLKTAKVMKSR